ncbi:hypothetical protein BpHYR1_004843 [Brachionus plicatilis]|uniref:Uncharacterized protein n=1 Tax=Brachionus plicatilis TaxID=10195 RepID=A0A3M7P575_BRAPC|nr:hypothetical protein BpHYR1_004843 [Brachionus plicatilis]
MTKIDATAKESLVKLERNVRTEISDLKLNLKRKSEKKNSAKQKLKRSSSESKLRYNESVSTDLTNSGLFKSKSYRLIDDNSLIKTYLKNQTPIRLYNSVPAQHMPPLHITNQDEVKKKFIDHKIPPVLKFKADERSLQNILSKHSKTNYEHFFKAKNILDTVKLKYPNLINYYEANFGQKITSIKCVDLIGKYLSENKISGDLTISFAPGLTCSGRITSYMVNKNDPSTRKFSIWINDGEENQFLRKDGIISLCDHEIGTHYFRSYNDGLQIWFNERKKFGLRPTNSTDLLQTEEGLAALNTLVNANLKYLFLPALLYYMACMADRMTFEQLYNHMENYIEIPEERWKLVTRVKRGISDPYKIGSYSRDQSYFHGAIDILQNLDNVDFMTLMSGKICLDECDRIKRIARTNSIKIPKFMKNMQSYKEKLRTIGIINGIIEPRPNEKFKKGTIVFEKNPGELKQNESKNPKELFGKNFKDSSLTSIEIKRYINREIVSKTKNTVEHRPEVTDNNSSLCIII